MDRQVRLRPIEESDLALLARFEWDPDAAGEFQWFGFRMDKARKLERRWRDDGLISDESSYLAVALDDGTCAGLVDWRPAGSFGNLEIGIVLFPEHRGHGIGTEAQRQLVAYLFSITTAHRLQAGTEVDNIAEQKSLERVGFRREGVGRVSTFAPDDGGTGFCTGSCGERSSDETETEDRYSVRWWPDRMISSSWSSNQTVW